MRGARCVVCNRQITPDRRADDPRVITCSPGCQTENKRRVRAERNRRYREKRRAKRADH